MKKEIQILEKFRIGQQFGEHEFDLDFFIILKSENGYNYEIYYYMKSPKTIKVYLAYNCDILSGIIVFTNEELSRKLLSIKANNQLNYNSIRLNKNHILHIFTKQNWTLTEEEIKEFVLLI